MPDCGADSKAARRISCATVIATLCLGALAGGADAQLYKWVDEKGRTQYSDKPDVPATMGYRLDGNTLILSVSSGLFAGEHTLTRK